MRRLGELEAEIMQRLWDWGEPATVREVMEDLEQSRRIAYTTVMTVMDNLYRKGILGRELDGRAYRYSPTATREEYHAELMAEVLAGSPDQAATLLRFVEKIGPHAARRMRRALDNTRRKPPAR